MIKRLAAILILDSGQVVNSYNFNIHLPVGHLNLTLRRLQEYEIDEVIILNTSHSAFPIRDFTGMLTENNSWHIATPLAYGGGISSVSDAIEIIKAGAERVVISPNLLLDSNIFFEICSFLGDQAIILHLPLEFKGDEVEILGHKSINFKSLSNLLPQNWGGEIMFSFVENDGAKSPNWKNVTRIIDAMSGFKNLILAGGFSNSLDISKGFEFGEVSAIAIGNYLHRSELSVINLKQDIDMAIAIRRQNDH